MAVVWGRVRGLLVLALEKADGKWSILLASLLARNGLATEMATRPYRTLLPSHLASVLRTGARV